MNAEPNTALHATVDGRVQGVGFRMFVEEKAELLHLTGWVRNHGDGAVEVWAEGPRLDLERLLDFLKIGPRSAFVTELRSDWVEPLGKYSRFSVVSTAW